MRTRFERPFHIDAWVVLPDHMHAVWTLPPGDRDFSTRWRIIKARFSRAVPVGERRPSHWARRERAVRQRRFWEYHIRSEADYRAAVEYCFTNPVKHGFVTEAEDWPYSSFRRKGSPYGAQSLRTECVGVGAGAQGLRTLQSYGCKFFRQSSTISVSPATVKTLGTTR